MSVGSSVGNRQNNGRLEKAVLKTRSKRAGNKILADTEETIVGIPVIVKPIEVKLTLIAVNIQIRNIAVAIGIVPNRADENHFQPSKSPPFQCCQSCILFEIFKSASWKCQVFYFLKTIFSTLAGQIWPAIPTKNNVLEFGRPKP